MAHVLAIVILPPLADFLRAPAVDGPRKLWEDRDDIVGCHAHVLVKKADGLRSLCRKAYCSRVHQVVTAGFRDILSCVARIELRNVAHKGVPTHNKQVKTARAVGQP